MSVTLAYGYGWRNSGDLAINQGSVRFLNTILESTTPRVVSVHPEESEEFGKTSKKFPWDDIRYDLVGGPMHYDPKTQSALEQYFHLSGDAVRYGLDLADISIFGRSLRSSMAAEIRNSDLVLYNGGNLIDHNRNLPYLLGVLYPLQVAKRYDIPYAVLPHTIFDIKGRYSRLITSVLEGAEFVWTRDARSYDYLASEFSLSVPLLNGIDTAFFLSEACNHPSGAISEEATERTIAVVPRFSTLGDTGDLQENDMGEQFEEFLARLTTNGYDVVLTVQTKVEENWAKRNEEMLQEHGIDVFVSYEPEELRNHYRQVDLLVTMRLHAGIFALPTGTPSIGVYREEWGPKTPGTWENLGIGEYVLSHEEMTADSLLRLCTRVFDNYPEVTHTIKDRVTTRKEYMNMETSRLLET